VSVSDNLKLSSLSASCEWSPFISSLCLEWRWEGAGQLDEAKSPEFALRDEIASGFSRWREAARLLAGEAVWVDAISLPSPGHPKVSALSYSPPNWGYGQLPQNVRGWQGPLWVTQPNPLPKQGHPEQAAQDLVQVGLEHLQRRRLHSLPGQPVPLQLILLQTRKAGLKTSPLILI